jgi:hypothetical protein
MGGTDRCDFLFYAWQQEDLQNILFVSILLMSSHYFPSSGRKRDVHSSKQHGSSGKTNAIRN